jgi:uncharacterized protein YbjT (DUF2867 family)
MSNLIGITGATGNVGSKVAQKLSEKNINQRLIVRDPERAPKIDGAEVVQADDYRDTAGMTDALQGVEKLFFVSGHFSDDRLRDHKSVVDAAVAAGVKHIVYLSFLNAAADATFLAARDHFHTEEYIRAQGIDFTFLRSSWYADVAPGYFAAEDATLRGPAGDGRISYVSRADLVEVAAIVLSEAGHENKTYDLTGREALSLYELADLLTEFTRRGCTYYNETLAEAKESRAKYGASDEVVDIWISTYTAIAAGELATVSNNVERITGHPPMTLREFLEQNPESYQHLINK